MTEHLRSDCHLLAEREILKALLIAGVLVGEIEALVAAELGPVFFPHGLGHLIGCDTHDVGGYLPNTPKRSTRAGLSKVTCFSAVGYVSFSTTPSCVRRGFCSEGWC